MRALLILTWLLLPGRALASEDVLVLSFGGAAEDAETGAWLPARLADVVGEKLERAGIGARDRRFEAREHVLAIVGGLVDPKTAIDPSTALTVELDLSVGTAKPAKKRVTGKAGEVEKIAADIAIEVAEALGQKISEPLRAKLRAETFPFAVHRTLGLARAHFDAGNYRKAMVMYDRAAELTKVGTIPEAIEGRLLAENELAGRGEATFGARADLAPPAAVRFEVARKNNDDKEAMRALEAYLKSTPERALRWKIEAPLERGTSTLIAHGPKWTLQTGEGDRKRWTIEPRTGAVLIRANGLRGLVSIIGGHPLALDQKTLVRYDENGRAKWKLALPVAPRGRGIEVSGGVAGIMGEREVVWVETSFGELGQRAKNVRPLGSSEAGVLVELSVAGEESEIGLLRPGKKSTAWTTKIPAPLDVALTGDRALIVTRKELLFLRTLDGKEAGRPYALTSSAEVRLIGAEGRYAVLDLGAATGIAIVDVLGAERTALVKGPSEPLASYTAANGVAIAFTSGDILFYERDGRLLDRARAPGKMFDLVPGNALVPGPVAVTSRGLYAYAEVPTDRTRMRDIDAILELAEALRRANEPAAALRITEWVAARSTGAIERAESLRADLLEKRGDAAAARAARARAEAAKDPTKPLVPFSLSGD